MSDALVKTLTDATAELRTLTTGDSIDSAKAAAFIATLSAFDVTPEALRSSGLNVALSGLRKHADAALATAAKQVIAAYKAKIVALAEAGALAAPSPTSDGTETPSLKRPAPAAAAAATAAASEDTPAHKLKLSASAPASSAGATVSLPPVSSPTKVFDAAVASSAKAAALKLKVALTGDKFRDKVQRSFYDALTDMTGEDAFRVELAVTMEEALLSHFKQTNDEYRRQWFLLLSHINDPKNSELRSRLYSGEIEITEVPTLTELDLAPKAVQQKREEMIRDANISRETDVNQGAQGTDMFPCPKCKSRNCSYTQRQTRSADEPMTIFLRCLECNQRWRLY